MERDRFFSAEQATRGRRSGRHEPSVDALEYGLVDRIVTSRELRRTPSGFAPQGV